MREGGVAAAGKGVILTISEKKTKHISNGAARTRKKGTPFLYTPPLLKQRKTSLICAFHKENDTLNRSASECTASLTIPPAPTDSTWQTNSFLQHVHKLRILPKHHMRPLRPLLPNELTARHTPVISPHLAHHLGIPPLTTVSNRQRNIPESLHTSKNGCITTTLAIPTSALIFRQSEPPFTPNQYASAQRSSTELSTYTLKHIQWPYHVANESRYRHSSLNSNASRYRKAKQGMCTNTTKGSRGPPRSLYTLYRCITIHKRPR